MDISGLISTERPAVMRFDNSPTGEGSPVPLVHGSRAGSPSPWANRVSDDAPSANELVQKTRKRKQVKLACTNCRRNHTACDSTRPCKRCVGANESHLCTDAPKRTKAKRFGATRPNSSYGSDGAGSSDEEHEHSESESHSHSHTHTQTTVPAAAVIITPAAAVAAPNIPAPKRRATSALPPYTAPRSSLIMAGRLADPEAAFNDETDYLSSLYLMELSRRAAIEMMTGTC